MKNQNVFIDNAIAFILGSIFTFLLAVVKKRLFSVNQDFFNLLNDFKKRLPPTNKKAEKIPNHFMTHLNLTEMTHHISKKEIDILLKSLEDLDYSKIIFKKKQITNYSKNIQRIINTTTWDKFLISILDEMLNDEKLNQSKLYVLGFRYYPYFKC